VSADDQMPPDPFGTGETIAELINEGCMIRAALTEAADRGALVEAVWSLDVGDFRALVLGWLLTERLKESLERREDER